MNAASVVVGLARRWAAIYTFGLPAETRDRRREEIVGDLWEQQHDEDDDHRLSTAAVIAVRVVSGMPADLRWRTGERRPIRSLELPDLAIDRTLDRRMRIIGRGVVLGAIALLVPIAVGLPALLVVTIPAAALVARKGARRDRGVDFLTDTRLPRQRRIRFLIVAMAVVVWALGFVVDSLPSDEMYGRYWFLFIAPSMIGFTVGVVAVPMLVWSLLPRRDTTTLDH